MLPLLWKDWRLSRPIFLTLGIVYAASYLIYFAVLIASGSHVSRAMVAQELIGVTIAAFVAMLAVTPAFGAVAFARERRERWAEFCAVLPIRRRSAVLSKALVAGAGLLIPLLLFALSAVAVNALDPHEFDRSNWSPKDFLPYLMLTATGFGMWGFAWLLSTRLRSETITTAVTIGATVATCFLVYYILDSMNSRGVVGPGSRNAYRGINWSEYARVLIVLFGSIGAISFLTGTWLALRRTVP